MCWPAMVIVTRRSTISNEKDCVKDNAKWHEFIIYAKRISNQPVLIVNTQNKMEQMTLYVGAVAGIFTGVSMLPQLIKIIKEKKAQAISFFMLVVLMTGLAGWIWYGILKKDLPVIFTNIFSFIINVLVVIFSYKYKKNNKEENE